MAAEAINLRAALGRINWSPAAQNAFVEEGFGNMSDIGYVTRDYLSKVCKKLRTGREAIPAAVAANPAIPAVRPVDIPLFNEFKLFGMHLWVIEKQRQGLQVVPIEFTQEVATEYTAKVRAIIDEKETKPDEMVKLPDKFGNNTDWVHTGNGKTLICKLIGILPI
jgi:hypothetical protein